MSTYTIKRLTIDNVSWTAVTPAAGCSSIGIKNLLTVDVKIRTDAADSNTEDVLEAGAQEEILAPGHVQFSSSNENYRFQPGYPVCYLQASTGSGTVVLRFA